ncbi:MAG: hypothetical protein HC769_15650 [Cyanobacteria bacterium CRU_2_1]|nr:hypothetical protein [Cyanobacteria bacterium RU_5_0]NJR60137.1 hypothetical protein [Cyanobacteria bacterium CRU_2_1]
MPYSDRLKRWIVVRLNPTMPHPSHVARFVKFSDAEGHAQILRRLHPQAEFSVLFDPEMKGNQPSPQSS